MYSALTEIRELISMCYVVQIAGGPNAAKKILLRQKCFLCTGQSPQIVKHHPTWKA